MLLGFYLVAEEDGAEALEVFGAAGGERHRHGVIDPGHSHPIRTIGDDYNGSGQGGTGNFVGDGNSDMTNENWRRGLYATSSYTGISLAPSSSNISLSRVNSNLSLQSAGGNRPHNNMPPYIRAYCRLSCEVNLS